MRNIIIASILMLIVFGSCQKIEGNGDVTTKTISIDGTFDEVRNDTKFDVDVVFSNENKVVITAESNISNCLSVKVKNKRLIIKKEKAKYRLLNTEPVTITVYMPRKDYLYFTNYNSGDLTVESPLSRKILFDNSGSGDILVYNTENEAVEIKNSGSGDIVIEGIAAEVKITNSGSGYVDCYNLTSQYVEIHSSGSGRVEAYATDESDVWLTGSGEVFVFGTERVRYHYSE